MGRAKCPEKPQAPDWFYQLRVLEEEAWDQASDIHDTSWLFIYSEVENQI